MTTNISEPYCLPTGNKWNYVFLMLLPILSGLVNILVWIAATLYRKKLLRHSYVYSSVASTLISNILFLCIHLWDEVEGFRMSDIGRGPMSDPGSTMEVLWSLCTAASVSMVFVVCGNLTALIYLMLESSYFRRKSNHSRSNSSSGKSLKSSSQTRIETKRRRALILIALVWLIPAILTLAAVLAWNCAPLCSCPPGSVGELCPRSMGCSRTWAPMRNSFIAVNVGLWFVEIIVLVYVTISGIRNFHNYNSRPSRSVALSLDVSPVIRNSFPNKSNGWDSVSHAPSVTKGPYHSPSDGDDDVFKPDHSSKFFSLSCHPRKLNPRLRLVCLLTTTFILCTIMVPVSYFVDITMDNYSITGVRFSSLVLVQLYTLICPLLLVGYLSGLKSAVVNMFTSCK